MISDILTKDKKEKFGLDDLMRENKLSLVETEDNCVQFDDGEFSLKGRKLRDKLMPKAKVPVRKKIKRKQEVKDTVKDKEKQEADEAGGMLSI